MLKWWEQYRNASSEMKGFILVAILFGACLLITTLHSYGRLNFIQKQTHLTEKK